MQPVVTTGFGGAAIEMLARLLNQRPHSLAPAVVVCARPMVAVGVRRRLGRRHGGIAGVSFVTVERLVEDLSAPVLAEAGRHPASNLELQAAIRAELAAEPGRFGQVATHRTTEERLITLDRQVAGLPAEQLASLTSAPGLSGDAFRVLQGARYRLGSASSSTDQLELALEVLDQLEIGALGPIIIYLPEPALPFEARMLTALDDRSDSTVVIGVTGEPEVDNRHKARLSGWGFNGVAAAMAKGVTPPLEAAPTGRVLEVPDPEDEVRAALREITAWAAAGTPLPDIALLYTATDPYASMIEQVLDAADIPFSAPGHRPLSASLAGRTLLRLLELFDSGLERSAVITLLSSAPIVMPGSGLVPTSSWDRLSRLAGVIDGDDWHDRLSTLAAHSPADGPDIARLLEFIAELSDVLDRARQATTWSQLAQWARSTLGRLLAVEDDWRPAELVALERVHGVLNNLSGLDVLDVAPTLESFAATLGGELDTASIPGRPAGVGLVVAPLRSVAGLGFDRVVVVGLNEGSFPGSGREDSLLSDQIRSRVSGSRLALSGDGPDIDVRAVTAVVAGASQMPLLVTARGDLRSRRSKSWPPILDHLEGERQIIESHHRSLVDHGRPVSTEDLGLRALVRHTDAGDPVQTHPLAASDPVLFKGLERHGQRHGNQFGRFGGRVPGGLIDPTQRRLSPTALEDYAGCPRKYLFGRVLRLGLEERPERIEEITPRDRGTLVHRVLELFLAEAISKQTVPLPDESWPESEVERLWHTLNACVDEAAAQGITGGRVQTELLRRALRKEVTNFIGQDNELRAERQSTPYAVEMRFGFDPERPGIIELDDGRILRMRGVIDRVDITPDGGVLVIDYKGGSDHPFRKMKEDPLKGGRRLQLPLYAQVVAGELGREGPRTALYWLTKQDALRPMDLDPALEVDLDDHVASALDGIEGGLFPGVPGGSVGWPRSTFENCLYCDFDRVCPTDRQREWDAVRADPALTPIDRLLGREESE